MAWEEVVGLRNRTCKTFADDLDPLKRLLQTQIGISKHYQDDEGLWEDIDLLAEEADSGVYSVKFTKLPYLPRMGNDSRRRIYLDRNDLSYWIEFFKPFPSMGTPIRQGRWFYWNFAHAIMGVRFDHDVIKFGFRLKDAQAPHSITIPFDTQGITRQGRLLLHDGEVVAELRKPIATGSNLDADGLPVQKECDVVFGPGEMTISLDPTGLDYPIDIDPTVDKQVAASGDDGYRTGSVLNTGGIDLYVGWNTTHSFARWFGVTISGTIDVSYVEVYGKGGSAASMGIYGVDEDNPAAPTSKAEFDADPLTAASVGWTGPWAAGDWRQSGSLNTIFQELVDTYTISNDAVMIQIKSLNSAYTYCRSYDHSGNAHGPKLHIEYSVGAAGVPTHMDNYHRRRVVQG